MSFLGELGGLGTGGDAIHPRALVIFDRSTSRAPLGQHVLSAIRASVSEASANPRMGTRFVAAQTPSECTTARTFGKLAPSPFDTLRLLLVSAHLPIPSTLRQASGNIAPRPFINDTLRTRRGLISGRYEPLTTGARALRPRAEAKPRRLHPSLHHVISIHVSISPDPASPPMRLGSSNPSPPSNDASPAAPSASPRASAFGALIRLRTSRSRRPPHPAHIHRRVLVHAPCRAIMILRPKSSPRAGHVPLLRASGSSVIASSTPPLLTHDPRTSPRLLSGDSMSILCLRNVFAYCRHSAQSLLSPCFCRARRQPPGIPRHDRQGGGSYYQPSMSHPLSISLI
ncbi:hypothetical protein B0H14DRAFT_3870778 [Mycena olivaceomarginata]|nr:hypothetical protein B0H14DRAFT_3870778 [Mycena olivaceomarginata]